MAKKKQAKKLGEFTVHIPIETSSGGTHWFQLGRAWESVKDGRRRLLVKLNAHPIGRDLHLFEMEADMENRHIDDGNAADNDDMGFLEDLPF